jgi:hypothetical protein
VIEPLPTKALAFIPPTEKKKEGRACWYYSAQQGQRELRGSRTYGRLSSMQAGRREVALRGKGELSKEKSSTKEDRWKNSEVGAEESGCYRRAC